jgi:hypothetical protein
MIFSTKHATKNTKKGALLHDYFIRFLLAFVDGVITEIVKIKLILSYTNHIFN